MIGSPSLLDVPRAADLGLELIDVFRHPLRTFFAFSGSSALAQLAFAFARPGNA
jgi:hypothetical protein